MFFNTSRSDSVRAGEKFPVNSRSSPQDLRGRSVAWRAYTLMTYFTFVFTWSITRVYFFFFKLSFFSTLLTIMIEHCHGVFRVIAVRRGEPDPSFRRKINSTVCRNSNGSKDFLKKIWSYVNGSGLLSFTRCYFVSLSLITVLTMHHTWAVCSFSSIWSFDAP